MNQKRYLEIRRSVDLRRNPKFLRDFGIQTLALLGTCAWILTRFSNSPWRVLAVPLITLFMFRSFAFMHEAVHGLLSKKLQTNHILGILSGIFCLLSYDSWKQAHIEHHRWSGNVDKDPVAAMIKTFPTFSPVLQKSLSIGWKYWIPTLSFLQHTVFWALTIQYIFKNKKSIGRILLATAPIFFWVALFSLLPGKIVISVFLPSIFLYLIGTEIINAPHHLGLNYFRGETKIPLWEQFKTARSCTYPKWLARFAVLNFNYHSEHHMYPYVPWYHLDKLQEKLCEELQSQYNLDPKFSWVLENRTKDLSEVFGSNQLTEGMQIKTV